MNAASGHASPGQPELIQTEQGQTKQGQPKQGQPAPGRPASPQPSSSPPASDPGQARRRIPRYPLAIPVDVTVLRSGLPSSIPGRSVDVGEGGVAAVLAAELQAGEWVAVEFQLPNAGNSLQTKAVVRHHNHLHFGFEFLGLSRDQRYMIRQWASTVPAKGDQVSREVRQFPEVPQFPLISSALAKGSATTAPQALSASAWAPAEMQPSSRAPQSSRISAASSRLLWLTLALLLGVALVSSWQWQRGWRQLDAEMARKEAHSRQPAARVSPEVMERLLIRKVEPVYPESARRAKIQGPVVLDAIIGADGTVVNLHLLKGPERLASSAMDAVRWWQFRPYRVLGEAAPVETSLTVEFHP